MVVSSPRHAPSPGRRPLVALAALVALTACAGAATRDDAAGGSGGGRQVALRPATEDTTPDDSTGTTEATGATGRPTTGPATTDTSTTAAPTTTTAATTTTVPPPTNRVPVAPTPTPLAAVGRSSGGETARVQQRLIELGFWVGEVDGDFGLTTGQAVMAFQKYLGLETSGSVDELTAGFLSGMTMRAYGHADSGTLLEVDKTRQILLFVVDGRTQWVFNTSTGNGQSYIEEDQNSPGTLVEGVSLTPDGLHEVNRERPEGWWEGDLGQIYRPKYFVGGVAVHGSNSVPNYPASHGCVRVTVPAMDFIWEAGLMPLELPVWVHQQPPPA